MAGDAAPRLRWGIIGTGVIATQFAEDLRSQVCRAAMATACNLSTAFPEQQPAEGRRVEQARR